MRCLPWLLLGFSVAACGAEPVQTTEATIPKSGELDTRNYGTLPKIDADNTAFSLHERVALKLKNGVSESFSAEFDALFDARSISSWGDVWIETPGIYHLVGRALTPLPNEIASPCREGRAYTGYASANPYILSDTQIETTVRVISPTVGIIVCDNASGEIEIFPRRIGSTAFPVSELKSILDS